MKKSKQDKELVAKARLLSEWIRKEFISLDQEGFVGVCMVMPVPKPIHEAISRGSPDVLHDIHDEIYTAYRNAIGRHLTISIEEGPDSGASLQ